MPFDPESAFDMMLCAYRSGLMDKFSAIQGEAIDDVMAEHGLNMGDIVNRMDRIGAESTAIADRVLGRIGFMFGYMANEKLMRLACRILDIKLVRRFAVEIMKKQTLRWLTAGGPAGTAAEPQPGGGV